MEKNLNRASSWKISWIWKDFIPVIVFVMVFVVDAKIMAEPSQFSDKSSNMGRYNSTEMSKLLKHLKKINKPPIKSIQSPEGDIIDCIDQHKQLAFDHPLLKNHKLREPPKIPWARADKKSFSVDNAQSWHANGYCPEGTIPVRRNSIEDLMRVKSRGYDGINGALPQHEYAIGFEDGIFYGARAEINLWAPKVETDEFSIAQIWILNGEKEALNSVEAGWQVYNSLYGSSDPRLFTYWTTDGYDKTGCFNLVCPGFVQVSRKIAVATTLRPVSTYNGDQFSLNLTIWKDKPSRIWCLAISDEFVGYWPSELFPNLGHATRVEWGGEIANLHKNLTHTSTDMGSGHFAEEGFGKSSFFRELKTVDDKNYLIDVGDFRTFSSNTNCYNINGSSQEFYFGGPGFSTDCP